MKGVLFESKKGNKYVYDNNSGHIFYVNKDSEYAVLNEYKEKLGTYKNNDIKDVSESDVKDYLIGGGSGFRQMILEVTSQCNFRCKYCCYSDCYEYTHGYTDEFMSYETGKKAVDLYLTNYRESYKRNPLSEPFIGFYGGEPLLNIKLIKEIIEYIKKEYSDVLVHYNITTNGYILNESIMQFLVDNDFAILISIDGDKKDHDRNRVTRDGRGTFDTIMEKLQLFRNKFPEYEKISISACYDVKTDLQEAKEFFESNGLYVTKFAAVESVNSSYYNQFKLEDFENYNRNLKELKDEMLLLAEERKLIPDRFVYQALGVGYLEFSYHCMIGDSKNTLIPYTGSCIPGEKIYVTPDGCIHLCEKINPHFNIGNVVIELDYPKIAKMINRYNDSIGKHCLKCNVSKLCNLCFAKFAKEDDFMYDPNQCANFKNHVQQILVELVDLLEADPALIENLTIKYYDNLMKYSKGGC